MKVDCTQSDTERVGYSLIVSILLLSKGHSLTKWPGLLIVYYDVGVTRAIYAGW